jgi:hypothetical protein
VESSVESSAESSVETAAQRPVGPLPEADVTEPIEADGKEWIEADGKKPLEADGTEPIEADGAILSSDAAVESDAAGTEPIEADGIILPSEDVERGAMPQLWLPPGWDKLRAWAVDEPHLPSWWEEGMRPEEDRDELLFRADVNFFFATALDGLSSEERALKKELLFRAQKNFFFAQSLDEKEPGKPPPPEEEPAYTIHRELPDTDSSAAELSKEEDLLPTSEPDAKEDEPVVSPAREKIRKMAESALSYDEEWINRPQRQPRARPAKREDSAASGHWWEKSGSTAPRQQCVKYPPSFGNMNI